MSSFRVLSSKFIYAILAISLLIMYFPNTASAEQITARKVTIGNSAADVHTTYTFDFTVPQTTVIKSVGFRACTTASGACTLAPGFADATGVNESALASQPSGLDGAGVNSGWTVSTATVGELRLSKSGATVAPSGTQTVSFSNVKNPTATNATFYLRITTYSDASWTAINAIDTGTVATSTAGPITVAAIVTETLNFSLATTTVDLGILSKTTTGTGTSVMTVGTNAASGYSVNYSGATLTSGSHTIDAMAGGASVKNSKQFGINLMANTIAASNPAVGSNVTGVGTGTPSTGYDTQDVFKFDIAGDVIASASIPTNDNVFTTSYIANIDSSTAAGSYTTILTYTVTTNF